MLHERNNNKWKFMKIKGKDVHEIFSTLSLGWHNLFTCHISKKNNMVLNISHKATLGWRNNIVQLSKWNPMFNHSLQCLDMMLHEMKRSGSGWQNIHLLIPSTWKCIQEWNNEVCQISHICIFFLLINNYVNMRCYIKIVLTIFSIVCLWL